MNYAIYLLNIKLQLGIYIYGKAVIQELKDFVTVNYIDKKVLDKELVETWLYDIKNRYPNTLVRKISVIRQLAIYGNSIGIISYIIPTNVAPKTMAYIPHVFTELELTAFFYAANNIPISQRTQRQLIVPVIFRLIYACGLRPGEAIRLKREHVNLEEGRIFIKESKGYKDRNVMLSDELHTLLIKFDNRIHQEFCNRTYFFAKDKENRFSGNWLNKTFWKCWEIAGVAEFHGSHPRVIDFRHTFATNRWLLWMGENVDFEVFMPYLSTYMGHSSIKETFYYFHLIPDFYAKASKNMIGNNDLIPEVDIYEY